MIQGIRTVEDVKELFKELYEEGLNFHPDDDFNYYFNYYINYKTKVPTYTPDEVAARNRLLDAAFTVCGKEGVDIYELCVEIFMADFYKAFPTESED